MSHEILCDRHVGEAHPPRCITCESLTAEWKALSRSKPVPTPADIAPKPGTSHAATVERAIQVLDAVAATLEALRDELNTQPRPSRAKEESHHGS